jgi:hypothetical protein
MATTTPSFGWPVPTSGDLVKNGATAIESLGDAIDASMAELKGGTTGQVLSKTSNTDMDFTWVAADDTNAIQNTIVDAKGDLIAASAADTPARLAVGANGETLVADSSTSTGLRYQATQAAGKNYIINGGMDVWQRGATGLGTSTGAYTADRWVLGSSSTTVTRDTDVPVSPYFQYSMKMVGTGTNSIIQKIESANSVLLAGQTITISFYAKRTSGAGALSLNLYYPSAVDNFTTVTQIGSAVVLSASPTSSWVRYQTSVAIGTNITAGLMMLIDNTGASTTFITGVQIEIGSIATQFTRATGTIQGELAACQRYFYKLAGGSSTVAVGFYVTNTEMRCNIIFPVTMRTNPTLVATSGTNYYALYKYSNSFDFFDSLTLDISSTTNAILKNTTEMSTTSANYGMVSTDSGSASVSFNGEL